MAVRKPVAAVHTSRTAQESGRTYPLITSLKAARNTVKRGLDNNIAFLKMGLFDVMEHPCTHARTEMIARTAGIDYVRCLECGQVYEAEDLEPAVVYDED